MCQMLDFLLKKFSNLNHPEFFEILLSLQLGVLLHGEAASLLEFKHLLVDNGSIVQWGLRVSLVS